MGEGSFRMDKKDIRYPNLSDQSMIKGHAFLCWPRKREPFIFPIMPEIKSHCKVLGGEKKRQVRMTTQHDESWIHCPWLLMIHCPWLLMFIAHGCKYVAYIVFSGIFRMKLVSSSCRASPSPGLQWMLRISGNCRASKLGKKSPL